MNRCCSRLKKNSTRSKSAIVADSRNQVRIDQAERKTFGRLLALGLTLLRAYVAGAGLADESPGQTVVGRDGGGG
ncbi:MAG: hypothetical protein KJ000_03080 [Pirellulaceae bacterium]|nr:hypothetical protein [Pirellulaceae bacterium]